MRTLIQILFGALIFATGAARADIVVSDPHGRIQDMMYSLGVRDWSQAFTCGDRRTFLRDNISCQIKCSAMSCMDTCEHASPADKQFVMDLEDCTEDSVSIYGSNGLSATLTKDEYMKTGTWVGPFLQSIGQFLQPAGEIEITFGSPRLFDIFENGQMRKEFGYVLVIEHKSAPGAMTEEYEVGFLANRSLLDSLVWFGTLEHEVFFKMKGVSLAN